MSGGITLLNNNIINWHCKQQQTVALSTAEAEYIALSSIVTECKWIINWFSEASKIVQQQFKLSLPAIINIDNTAAIQIASNDSHHNKTKHINLRYHFVRNEVYYGTIKLKWISTQEQNADILTKKLSVQLHHKFMSRLLSSPPEQFIKLLSQQK